MDRRQLYLVGLYSQCSLVYLYQFHWLWVRVMSVCN